MSIHYRDIIDLYRAVVVQIGTPQSTGTGCYLRNYGYILTNEHVVRGYPRVIIEAESIERQLADVIYLDALYDIALLQAPAFPSESYVKLSEDQSYSQGDAVIAVGHPFGLEYSATQGILSNVHFQKGDTIYLQHDAALNPGNSGGPLVNMEGEIIGLNTFIWREGNSIGLSLPSHTIREILGAISFLEPESTAVRCRSCAHLVHSATIEEGYCPRCGAEALLPADLPEYTPSGIRAVIEQTIDDQGLPTSLTRQGASSWQIPLDAGSLTIRYAEKEGMITLDAVLLSRLEDHDLRQLYEVLLRECYTLPGLTIALHHRKILLSAVHYVRFTHQAAIQRTLQSIIHNLDRLKEAIHGLVES